MYKKLLALCLAALLTASAAGCSQGTEGGSAPAEGGSAPAGDAAPSGEVVTIRMGGWGNFEDEHAPGTVGMEEAIGVKIEFQKYPTDADFWNNLPAQIAAKTAPDFISLTNELYLPYINDGLVVPLTSYVEDGTISCWDSIAQSHHLLHVYPEVLRAGNRHVWNQELNPGPGTGFPALQY